MSINQYNLALYLWTREILFPLLRISELYWPNLQQRHILKYSRWHDTICREGTAKQVAPVDENKSLCGYFCVLITMQLSTIEIVTLRLDSGNGLLSDSVAATILSPRANH